MNELVKKLFTLANRWEQMAVKQVPPEYANRDLHHKYFHLDNEAAGLYNCAEELRELLEIESRPTPRGTDRATRCACGNVISPADKCEGCAGLV